MENDGVELARFSSFHADAEGVLAHPGGIGLSGDQAINRCGR
jgi:hypothetical protein